MSETGNGYNCHDHLKDRTVEELKAISEADRLPFAVALMNVQYDLNVGNIVRTAHCLGAERVFILGGAKFDSRACVGSQNYIEIHKSKCSDSALPFVFDYAMGKYNYSPFIIDKTNLSYPISYMKMPILMGHRPCLVFGNENAGIPEEILNNHPRHFHIPQRGIIRSMNVSAAAAIAINTVSDVLGG